MNYGDTYFENNFEIQGPEHFVEYLDFDIYEQVSFVLYELDSNMSEKDFLKEMIIHNYDNSLMIQNRAIRFANVFAQENKVPVHILLTTTPKESVESINTYIRQPVYTVRPI